MRRCTFLPILVLGLFLLMDLVTLWSSRLLYWVPNSPKARFFLTFFLFLLMLNVLEACTVLPAVAADFAGALLISLTDALEKGLSML